MLGRSPKDGLGKLGGTGGGDDGSGSDDSFDGDTDGSDSSSIDSDMLDMQGAENVTDNLDFVLGELLEAPQEDAEVAALEDILDDSGSAPLADATDLGAEGVEYEDSDSDSGSDDAAAAGESAPGTGALAAAAGPVAMKCPVVLSAPVPAELPGGVRVGVRWPGVMQPAAAEDHTNTRLGLRFGVAEDQGKRDGMEDRMMALGDMNTMLGLEGEAASQAYFGVYDGHMGTSTSNMLAERLHLAVVEELGVVAEAGGDPEDALKAAFVRTDREWVREQVQAQEDDQSSKFSGATAIVAMVREEEIIIVEDEQADAEKAAEEAAAAKPAASAASGAGGDDAGASDGAVAAASGGHEDDLGGERKRVRLLYVANAGDCRAVLCRGGWAVDLSTDHKASLESEKTRVEAAGGSVHNGRVNGVIAVTRAFGDPEFKALKDKAWWGGSFTDDVLTATPDVRSQEITPYDEFVVMACDGVWDVMTSQQAVNFVRRRLREEPDIQAATEALVAKALQLASVDNVSAIVFAVNQLAAT
jgi:serine/threonine protein phosphatase PrpC